MLSLASSSFRRANTSTSKAKTARASPAMCINRSTTSPGRGTLRFFALTAARSGPITRNSNLKPNFLLRMGTRSFCRIPADPLATAKSTPRPFGRTGATRIFRTIWPWWITPSSKALRIRQSLPSAAGPMAASPPTSSSLRPIASRRRSQERERAFLSVSMVTTTTSATTKRNLVIPGRAKPFGRKFRPSTA